MIAGPPPPAQAEGGASPPQHDEREATQAHILRSAGVVSAAVLLSRITGLVREVVFARFFGASLEYDAFIAAFRDRKSVV